MGGPLTCTDGNPAHGPSLGRVSTWATGPSLTVLKSLGRKHHPSPYVGVNLKYESGNNKDNNDDNTCNHHHH